MKTPAHPTRVRLTCRLISTLAALRETDRTAGQPEATGFVARHLASCPACQEARANHVAFDARLRHTAAVENTDFPAGLETRLIAGVHRARHASRPVARRTAGRPIWFTAATLAACALVAVGVWRQLEPVQTPTSTTGIAISSPADGGAFAGENEAGVAGLWTTLQPSTDSLLAAAPLQTEAEAVYADARSALGFLALNFLPATPAGTSFPDAGPVPSTAPRKG